MKKLNIENKIPDVYEIYSLSDTLYAFHTVNGVIYELGFKEDNPLGGCETYQFYINSVNNNRPRHDIKVKNTVVSVLKSFFEENKSVILYVCDTSDNRQLTRSNLFERWFNDFPEKNNFVILSGCLRDEDIENYASIIVEVNNPKLKDIVNDFTETLQILSSNKP